MPLTTVLELPGRQFVPVLEFAFGDVSPQLIRDFEKDPVRADLGDFEVGRLGR